MNLLDINFKPAVPESRQHHLLAASFNYLAYLYYFSKLLVKKYNFLFIAENIYNGQNRKKWEQLELELESCKWHCDSRQNFQLPRCARKSLSYFKSHCYIFQALWFDYTGLFCHILSAFAVMLVVTVLKVSTLDLDGQSF